MIQLNPEKVAKLHSYDDLLDKKYGKRGTTTRTIFEEKAMVAYYSDFFKSRRKKLRLTQRQLAERVGKERSYIAHIERGKTDMQLSSFISISNALGLRLSLQA
ncbi:MAG: helix-turn-helix domain-containing protein [Prevotellaceae bacterium]|jgi:DNA-binding XRE family transcriptional regulator|nr:helix-turn-helix domain-containing protein [Prevotellaceae bacterium]